MKKIILFSLILASSHLLKAQTFPYLNASTGNKNEFIVDVDSNIFMFHGTLLEKYDKNFNPIWAKNYSGLKFSNLLLSKTGSLFFIAWGLGYNVFGKLDGIGNLNWCKALPTYTTVISGNTQTVSLQYADQMLLDRNNNLIITGTGPGIQTIGGGMYFLKLDTLGNFIKLRVSANTYMPDPNESMIINDVNGVYTVSSWGYESEGGGGFGLDNIVYKYAELTDSIINNTFFPMGYVNSGYSVSNQHVIKSKHNSDTYYTTICNSFYNSALNNTFNLTKVKGSTNVFRIQFQILSPYLMTFQNLEEDDSKNVFLSIAVENIYNNYSYEKWLIKLDSNGVSDNIKHLVVQHPAASSSYSSQFADTITQLQHHFGNNFFYSLKPNFSASDPLTIIKMDTTIGSYCSPSASISITSSSSNYFTNNSTTVTSVSSVTLSPVASTVTSVSNFSVIINSCLPLWTKEFELNHSISIFPNPTTNKLNIHHSENFSIIESSIFDITGKLVAFNNHQAIIDVSKLNSGIYFIKVITDKGEFSQKFIKE